MNERLFRTQFNQMDTTEKQALMESLAARYDMTFLGLHTFDRWGQSCTTGIFKKDGREFVFVPGDTVILGWEGFAFGGWFAIKGFITVGTIQAFILYSKQFSRPINEIANQFANIQTAIAGAERIFEVMDADKETDEGKADFEVENVKGDIDFKHIDFSYVPEKQVLKDLDLEVKAGQKIAIVGATGSGKTTIVNLLTRFYPVDSGEITIDGQSIYDIPKDKLRRSIAIVLQDTVLFKGGVDGCDCEETLRLIAEGKIDTEPLITHTYPLRRIAEGYELFEKKRDGVIKVAVEC